MTWVEFWSGSGGNLTDSSSPVELNEAIEASETIGGVDGIYSRTTFAIKWQNLQLREIVSDEKDETCVRETKTTPFTVKDHESLEVFHEDSCLNMGQKDLHLDLHLIRKDYFFGIMVFDPGLLFVQAPGLLSLGDLDFILVSSNENAGAYSSLIKDDKNGLEDKMCKQWSMSSRNSVDSKSGIQLMANYTVFQHQLWECWPRWRSKEGPRFYKFVLWLRKLNYSAALMLLVMDTEEQASKFLLGLLWQWSLRFVGGEMIDHLSMVPTSLAKHSSTNILGAFAIVLSTNDVLVLERLKKIGLSKDREAVQWRTSLNALMCEIQGLKWRVEGIEVQNSLRKKGKEIEELVGSSSELEDIYIALMYDILDSVAADRADYCQQLLSCRAEPMLKLKLVFDSGAEEMDVADILSIIFESGLIEIYHDGCESFNTNPWTNDLLQASFLSRDSMQIRDTLDVAAEINLIGVCRNDLVPVVTKKKVLVLAIGMTADARTLTANVRIIVRQERNGTVMFGRNYGYELLMSVLEKWNAHAHIVTTKEESFGNADWLGIEMCIIISNRSTTWAITFTLISGG